MPWPFLHHRSFLAFAHRGGNLATENTVEAFSGAQELGFNYIETDVRLTSDGVVVVFHDASLNRLMGRPEYISDLSWSELSKLTFPGGERIPTLDNVFSEFPDIKFAIEPKSDLATGPLIRLLAERKMVSEVCVGSFSSSRVRRAQAALGPELCTSPGGKSLGLLLAKVTFSSGPSSKYGCVQLPMKLLSHKFGHKLVQRFQAAGLQVHVWTLNTESEMRAALALGVDGIMSDQIELLKRLLSEEMRW